MTSDPQPMPVVRDDRHRLYTLHGKLAQGGQGSVWRTEHPDVIVKLRTGRADEVLEEVRRIRHLPLQDLPIARPESVVSVVGGQEESDNVGFVMELEHGRRPLEEFLEIPDSDVAGWWRRFGGTESRLRVLAAAAAVIAQLHRRGVVVGDISPRNLLMTRASDPFPVVLVDPDDLHYADDPPAGDVRFSAPHVAPEVFGGQRRHDRRSDSYAVALLIAHALLLEHPLRGLPVTHGPPAIEIEALRGELPWIYDRDDDTNPAQNPRDLRALVGEEMTDLFHRCFGAGRKDPAARPTAAALAHALFRAADACRRCTCGDGGPQNTCVSCGGALSPGLIMDDTNDPRTRISLWDSANRVITRRVVTGELDRANDPVVLAGTRDDGARIELVGDLDVAVVRGPDRELLHIGSPTTMTVGDDLQIGDRTLRLRHEDA